jgi:hypothetical protein
MASRRITRWRAERHPANKAHGKKPRQRIGNVDGQ